MDQSIVDTWTEEWLQPGIQQEARLKEAQVIRHLLDRGTFSPEEIASLVNVDMARMREAEGNKD